MRDRSRASALFLPVHSFPSRPLPREDLRRLDLERASPLDAPEFTAENTAHAVYPWPLVNSLAANAERDGVANIAHTFAPFRPPFLRQTFSSVSMYPPLQICAPGALLKRLRVSVSKWNKSTSRRNLIMPFLARRKYTRGI